MNNAEKQAAAASLRDEATVIRQTRENYKEARANIEEKIKVLSERPQTQSVIWQKQYQEALKQQLDTAIDTLSSKNYANIHRYLEGEYENGFIGTMYSLQKQGIPLALPIDQRRVVKMVETTAKDIKLSKRIYGNTTKLKNAVRREVSIGLASGESYQDIAGRLSRTMGHDYNKMIRIARTEGGRVQNGSRFDAMKGAKKSGADIVKQWDSTLDNRTRTAHRELDGQIRELEDKFEAEGQEADHPHGFGVPWMDINCRCVVVQRARWAIDDSNPDFEDYTKFSRFDPETFDRDAWIRGDLDEKAKKHGGAIIDLSDARSFAEFKRRYKIVSNELVAKAAATAVGVEALGEVPEAVEVAREIETTNVFNVAKVEFTEKEIKAVEDYVSGEMMHVNQLLRRGLDMTDEEKELVKILDSLTTRNEVGETTLYRSVDASAIFGHMSRGVFADLQDAVIYGVETPNAKRALENAKKRLNKPITEKGFMSTTKDKDVAIDWDDFTGADNPIVMEIKTSKKTKGIDVSEIGDKFGDDDQSEVLLARNQTYVVTDIRSEYGRIIVDVLFK